MSYLATTSNKRSACSGTPVGLPAECRSASFRNAGRHHSGIAVGIDRITHLAPIVEERTAARVAKPIRGALQRLAGLAIVVVITGRSRKDALAILGFEPHLVIGNHGAEWPSDMDSRNCKFLEYCLKWRGQLHDSQFSVKGVEIEFKGESISLHYRKAEEPDKALALIHAAIDYLEPVPRRIGGKYVVNVVPMEAFGKGDALTAAMDRFGSTRAVYFGDDETDEEVFRLKRDEVLGVHVGKDDRTAATYYLNQQSEMLGLLNSILGILELHRENRQDGEDG